MNEVAQAMQKATFDRARALVGALTDPTQSTIIETKMDKNGGFWAANLSNKTIEYAYPTSPYAEAAKMRPVRVAEEMLHSQSHIQPEADQPEWMQDRWTRMREAMLKAEPFSRFTDPAYQAAKRSVARTERSIRKAVR